MKKLVVSRKNLKNNLKIIRKILNAPGKDDSKKVPQIIGVVKGNGMGLGLIEYSKFLVNNGINFLAVANQEEIFALRKAGIKEEILMMTPVFREKELKKLAECNIIFCITSVEQIEKLEKIAHEKNIEIKAHIKIDTGFGRYGFLYTRS